VFSNGRIEQLDTPRELYNRPQTAFVARFVGSANVVQGETAQRLGGPGRAFAIRPELIDVLPGTAAAPAGHVQCSGEVLDALYHGASSRMRVQVDAQTILAVDQAELRGAASAMPAAGTLVRLAWHPDHAVPLRD
jgi:putative spermidine/putrescine transport system ATP-binding protein